MLDLKSVIEGEVSKKKKKKKQRLNNLYWAWQPTALFLPGESPWTEDPGGVCEVAKSWTQLSD